MKKIRKNQGKSRKKVKKHKDRKSQIKKMKKNQEISRKIKLYQVAQATKFRK